MALLGLIAAPAQARLILGNMNIGGVWPVGDSITQGNSDGDTTRGSYRATLYDLLSQHGYTFSFTGHQNVDNGGLPVGYQYHSGVSGAVIKDNYSTRKGIQQNLPTWWSTGQLATTKPNLILLMIGTNDLNIPYDVANAPSRLDGLIQALFDLSGDVSMIVASIPPIRTTTVPAGGVSSYNAAVPGIVQSYKNAGKDIYYLDMFTAIDSQYSTLMRTDNLHPNNTGNNVMANQWFSTIESVVPEPTGLLAVAAGGVLVYRRRR